MLGGYSTAVCVKTQEDGVEAYLDLYLFSNILFILYKQICVHARLRGSGLLCLSKVAKIHIHCACKGGIHP